MMPTKNFTTISIEKSLLRRVTSLRKEEGRTTYGMIRVMVDVYEEWKRQAEVAIGDKYVGEYKKKRVR